MSRTVWPAIALACLAACAHEAPVPALFSPVAGGSPPPMLLAETSLSASSNLDALLDAFVRAGGEDEALHWLQEAAARLEPAELARNPGARQLAQHAVFRLVRASGVTARFEAIRGIIDTLQVAAPDAPETIFARAFLRWVLLTNGKGVFSRRDLDRSIAVDLARDLRALVERFPHFDGPADFDHRRLAQELAATEILLAESATPTALPDAASPDAS